VGSAGQGVFRAEPAKTVLRMLINISAKDGFSDSFVSDIEQMTDGSVWVATTNGASIFSDPNELTFTNISSSSNAVNSATSDAIRTLLIRHLVDIIWHKHGRLWRFRSRF